ncbi:MAG: hydroxymethylbilane synthase [Proteobacteria bacterium]|nr:hydroxymethylbilane synthase [Pseudomonadota bacterium]
MSTPRILRIGTRGSQLALWQARHVESLLQAQPGAPAVELVHIRTAGDLQTEVPLWQTPGRGFFTREIDRALLAGEVDIAVHSLKDLTTAIEAGLTLAAALPRADPRDVLLSRDGRVLAQLPHAARIGSSSLRRRAFLAHLRGDLEPLELRGNVPTRLEKLQRGDYDGIVLAAAGLTRLGLQTHVSEYLAVDAFPPAVSQGIIGVCARAEDAFTQRWLAPLDDREARLAATAERALLAHIEGGCQVPLGALAQLAGGSLQLSGSACAVDGSRRIDARATVELGAAAHERGHPAQEILARAAALGVQVAEQLLQQGAARLIDVPGRADPGRAS